jgi:hypothetical protein
LSANTTFHESLTVDLPLQVEQPSYPAFLSQFQVVALYLAFLKGSASLLFNMAANLVASGLRILGVFTFTTTGVPREMELC